MLVEAKLKDIILKSLVLFPYANQKISAGELVNYINAKERMRINRQHVNEALNYLGDKDCVHSNFYVENGASVLKWYASDEGKLIILNFKEYSLYLKANEPKPNMNTSMRNMETGEIINIIDGLIKELEGINQSSTANVWHSKSITALDNLQDCKLKSDFSSLKFFSPVYITTDDGYTGRPKTKSAGYKFNWSSKTRAKEILLAIIELINNKSIHLKSLEINTNSMRPLTEKDKQAISAIDIFITEVPNIQQLQAARAWKSKVYASLVMWLGKDNTNTTSFDSSDGIQTSWHQEFRSENNLDVLARLNQIQEYIKIHGVINNNTPNLPHSTIYNMDNRKTEVKIDGNVDGSLNIGDDIQSSSTIDKITQVTKKPTNPLKIIIAIAGSIIATVIATYICHVVGWI